jgi:HK97 gp10 family phage protein
MADEYLQGFSELMGALDRSNLSYVDRRKLVVKSLREGGTIIQERAKELAPSRSGRLREKNIRVSVVDQTSEGAEARIGITDAGFPGKFAELGTRHQRKTPWLGPSYDEKLEAAVNHVGDTLGDGIVEGFGND